ncbi:crossover junction endodeoxyribonuclease RuvC [Prevotella cerevisiae]|jgi:crossover junction endodeoxyribonuclease RuvC|uniref:Crossover junction endodeoxyribonuclease RuvC n=1 Tax=Segatella cerevisiae TaxID=2053716 RepID=A0ABT1BU81_9BACT|nr:crossover junction endodeoxyribonuclease RuvC [Segatella cerevisiae]MCH3993655.1 crossover junction endodeoxyribonuclease RuvC [Prevotella sp.]MCO6024644.1 crossover junction endodeoxyribonuclease RuvC [Segatella cerevisiae]
MNAEQNKDPFKLTATRSGEKTILGIDPGTNVMGYGVISISGNHAHLIVMGVINMKKERNPYTRLGKILERVTGVLNEYHPDVMAIEAPFFGKNVQSMLKLGRAQGVAIAAAIHYGIPIQEYAPLKIKMAITGQGRASKEQVAGMLQHLLNIKDEEMPKFMDATDALGAAYCHFLQMSTPETGARHYSNWKEYLTKHQDRLAK